MRSSAPRRVLLVPSAYYPHVGGIEEMTRRLALALRERSHTAMVLTNLWPAGVVRRELLDGVVVRRIAFALPAARADAMLRFAAVGPRSAVKLLRVVRSFRPHVIHLMGAGPNAVYVAALRNAVRVPIVLTAHGEFRNDANRAFDESQSLRRGLRVLLRDAAAVSACSQVVLDELREAFTIAAPASVIPNAVELAEFDGAPVGPDDHGGYVLAAGRLVEQKGMDLVLRAYALAGESVGARRLVVAGDGPERAGLEALARALGIGERVSFFGDVPRPRFAGLMCGADAFVFPSRKEAFGLALLEAMAAGVPAVAARVGGIPDFARDGENALLVAPEDPRQLAAALKRLLEDRPLRERLISGGRAQAERHSWAHTVGRYEALYASAAPG